MMLKEKLRNGNYILILGVIIFLLAFSFLSLAGRNYTGIMSFLSPLSFVLGVILIALGLLL